jgi:hypothetical protein
VETIESINVTSYDTSEDNPTQDPFYVVIPNENVAVRHLFEFSENSQNILVALSLKHFNNTNDQVTTTTRGYFIQVDVDYDSFAILPILLDQIALPHCHQKTVACCNRKCIKLALPVFAYRYIIAARALCLDNCGGEFFDNGACHKEKKHPYGEGYGSSASAFKYKNGKQRKGHECGNNCKDKRCGTRGGHGSGGCDKRTGPYDYNDQFVGSKWKLRGGCCNGKKYNDWCGQCRNKNRNYYAGRQATAFKAVVPKYHNYGAFTYRP